MLSCTIFSPQHNVMLQRRHEGIKPDMPTAQEREEILASLGGKPYWNQLTFNSWTLTVPLLGEVCVDECILLLGRLKNFIYTSAQWAGVCVRVCVGVCVCVHAYVGICVHILVWRCLCVLERVQMFPRWVFEHMLAQRSCVNHPVKLTDIQYI